jgi:4-amino-4-deoxy-L-arabinose transferase-like glycosyltransferase
MDCQAQQLPGVISWAGLRSWYNLPMRSKLNPGTPWVPRRLLTPDFLLVSALFLFALALRAYGVRGSLPYVGHPDEPKLVDSAIHIVKSGDLNPHLYIWPSLYIYLEALVVKAQLVWGLLRGYYAGPQSLPDVTHIFTLAPGVYVWARTLTAVLGAATVCLLYVVGREMFNGSRRVGVAAALLLAVSPLHVEYSHYALTDVPLGLVGLLVLWASYRLSRAHPEGTPGAGNRLWPAILCGLLVGIATGTKYNGLYLGVVPVVAILMQVRAGRLQALRSIAGLAGGAVLGFVLCEPYVLLDWPAFYRGFTFQVQAYEPARSLGEVWAAVSRHVADLSASDAYVFGPALLGAVALLFNPPVRNRAWLLGIFPLVYLLAMSRFYLTYVRNLIVTLPFLAIMAGYVVDLAATQLTGMARTWAGAAGLPMDLQANRRLWGAVRWGLVGFALVLILAQPLRVSTAYSLYMADPESRNLAWDWMRDRMKEGARFAAELHPWQTQDWPDVLAFDVENPDHARPATEREPAWYARRGYNLVVLSSNYRDAQRDAAVWEQYRKLPVVQRFPGDKDGGKGPTITVVATDPNGGTQVAASPPMMKRSGARMEDFGELLGYDLAPMTSTDVLLDPGDPASGSEYEAGGAIGLNLYYRAARDGRSEDPGWQVWIHLVDPASGNTVAQLDVPPLTGQLEDYPRIVQQPHPVARWHAGELLAGVYNLGIPPGLPPGSKPASGSRRPGPAPGSPTTRRVSHPATHRATGWCWAKSWSEGRET